MKLNFKNITKLLIKAYEKQQEQKIWEMYLMRFQNMDKDNYVSFEDFKSKGTSVEENEMTPKELIEQAEKIKQKHQKGGE